MNLAPNRWLLKLPGMRKDLCMQNIKLRNLRISMTLVGSLLMGLGMLIGGLAVASAISDARQAAIPANSMHSPDQSGQGFDPIIIPEDESVGALSAPALLPQPDGLKGSVQILTPTIGIPASPTLIGLDPVAGKVILPTETPMPIWIPDRIVIPVIKLDAPVIAATLKKIKVQGQPYQQWVPPNGFAVGQITTSAPLGVAGNTVLIGHHNEYLEVFAHLVDLQVGNQILVYSGEKMFAYVISLKMILPERDQPVAVRLKNAHWIANSIDERLTLVTCWPYDNNTHRLVIVATPFSLDDIIFNIHDIQ